jgi:hypothetical protein
MVVNSLCVALNKSAYLIRPYWPFQDLFCEISDNLACRRDMPIRQTVDMS